MSGYFLLLTSLDLNNIPSIGPNEVDKIVKKGSKTKQSSTDKKMKFQPKDLYYGRLNGVSGLLSLFSSVSSNVCSNY